MQSIRPKQGIKTACGTKVGNTLGEAPINENARAFSNVDFNRGVDDDIFAGLAGWFSTIAGR